MYLLCPSSLVNFLTVSNLVSACHDYKLLVMGQPRISLRLCLSRIVKRRERDSNIIICKSVLERLARTLYRKHTSLNILMLFLIDEDFDSYSKYFLKAEVSHLFVKLIGLIRIRSKDWKTGLKINPFK